MLIYRNKSLILQPAATEQSITWIFHSLAPLKHSNVAIHPFKFSFLENPEAVLLQHNCFDNSNSERIYNQGAESLTG